MSSVVTGIFIRVELIKLGIFIIPSHVTIVMGGKFEKPVPLISKVKSEPPAVAEDGFKDVIVGEAAFIKVVGPNAKITTVIDKIINFDKYFFIFKKV